MHSPAATVRATEAPPYSMWQLVLYFLKLGTLGFGGPVALVGYMQRDLVEERHWISDEEYKTGLALAQLAPGPLAAQLAIYLGYVHYGTLGATLAGLAFVLPSFVMVVAAGWAYLRFGGLPWMQAVFYGVGAAVIGIIAHSAYKLTRRQLGRDKLLWVIWLTMAGVTAVAEREIVSLVLLAGVLAWLARARPLRRAGKSRPNKDLTGKGVVDKGVSGDRVAEDSVASMALEPSGLVLAAAGHAMPAALPGPLTATLWQVALFFGKAGAFVFGSGLAIVPFLYGGLVKELRWLTVEQFLDSVAVAMITPGPVVITTGFIGYLVAGFGGAVVAALATFLPCYLFTVIPAPYFKKYGQQPVIAAFVDGVTTAAIGAIVGAVIVLGRRSIVDLPTALLALATLVLLWRARKIPEPVIVLVAAAAGLALHPLA